MIKPRKPHRVLTLCLLLALLLCPAVAAAQGANLASNGDFETGDGPDGWTTSAWFFGEIYTKYSTEDVQGMGRVARIDNYEPNDARYVQTLALTPKTTYRISAKVRFEGEGTCNLSFLDTQVSSALIHDTGGTWSQVEFFVVTEKKQKEAQLALRVGYYGQLERGSAWFDDVVVEAIDAAPVGARAQSLKTNAPVEGGGTTDESGKPDSTGITSIVLGAGFALFGALLYSRVARGKELTRPKANVVFLGGILLTGFLLRAYLAYKTPGYEVDINCFVGWGNHFLSVGPSQFYFTDVFSDYPPGYMPILGLLAAITNALGLGGAEPAGQLILKMPSILADVGACFLLYHIALKVSGSAKWGLFAAVLYALCPPAFANSAMWGQVDGLLTLLMALSIWCMVSRKMMPASIFFCLGVLIKPQALMFGPTLLFAFLHGIYESPKKGLLKLAACFGVCAGIFILAVLPFNGLRNPMWIVELYMDTMGSYGYGSANAMNLFALWGGNWVPQDTLVGPLSYVQWGTIGMIGSIGLAFFLYGYHVLKNKGDRRALPVVTSVLLAGVFCFAMRMHERYLFPVLLMLLICFLLYKDRRFLLVFFGMAAGQIINTLVVLAHQHILVPGDTPFMWIGGVLHIASTIYLFYLAFMICIRKQDAAQSAPFAPFAPAKKMVVSVAQPNLMHPGGRDISVKRMDVLLMLLVIVPYALLSFFNLGDTKAPQSSFQASKANESIVLDLGEVQDIKRFYFYGEIPSGDMRLSFSEDGELYANERVVTYKDYTMFRWLLEEADVQARYARVEFISAGLKFFEFALTGYDGVPYEIEALDHTGGRPDQMGNPYLLFDEQALVPENPSYLNSTYFDEIYHANTAYEQINDLPWKETSHPPLGKVFISWCISLLGMTPFAWRLAGNLAGILMLPGMYMLGKVLFKRRELAFAAMLLMAVDVMHFAQTRIATIDSFPVLFIIWSYFFMFVYCNMSFYHDKLSRTLPPLLASGIFMGLGCASKWIGFYAAAGLAVLFFYALGKRFFEYREAKMLLDKGGLPQAEMAHMEKVRSVFPKYALITCLCCIGFFIVIPLLIYVGSFYQYLRQPGRTLKDVWDYQVSMFNYHSNVFSEHPYSSTWYQWPIIWKPMAFYFDSHMQPGWSSAISTFGNPAIWWMGLVTMVWTILRLIRGDARKDPRLLLVVLGYAAQFLPWVLVPRTVFIYHYFASIPFLILSICFWLEELLAKDKKKGMILYLAIAGALFIVFYPAASGLRIPIDFAKLLNWLPQWQLYWG